MAYMEWTEAMSVGLSELDADHKTLIRVINQLAENAGDTSKPALLRQCIFALMRYAEFHFGREEQVMNACEFPQIDEHKDEHKDFVAEIQGLARRFEEDEKGAAAAVNEELLDYLKNWLTHHIMIVDMAYRPFIEGRAEARKAAQEFKAAEIWWSA